MEGAVALRVGGAAPRGRGTRRRLGERAQFGPARGGHRAGEAQHHRDFEEGADLGEFGQLARPAPDDPEAPVRYDLDGAFEGELLHRLADGCGGHPEAFAEHGRRVHLAGGEFARDEGGAQGVEDLPADRGPLDHGARGLHGARALHAGVREGLLAVGVLATGPGGGPGLVGGDAPLPLDVRRPCLCGHPDGRRTDVRGRRPGGNARAQRTGLLLHGVLLRAWWYLGVIAAVVTRPSSTIGAHGPSSNIRY